MCHRTRIRAAPRRVAASSTVVATPCTANEVTPTSVMPHGMIPSKSSSDRSTLSAMPCLRTA